MLPQVSLLPSLGRCSPGPLEKPEEGRSNVHPSPRLLIVDDVDDNRAVLARRFQRRHYQITEAVGGLHALELLSKETYDAVLLDIVMPDLDGLQVLRQIRLQHSPEALPVIMVTADNRNSTVVESLELGANDYVTKPVDFAIALARVKAQVDRKFAIEALAQSNQRLIQSNAQLREEMATRQHSEAQTQYLAHHDALTGLGNRLLYREKLRLALCNPHVLDKPLALLFVDLDGFKSVNDAHGHSIGDALLKKLASRLVDRLGNTVHISRFGGDEFAVLQSCGDQPASAAALAGQLIEIINEPSLIEGHILTVDASVGITFSDQFTHDIDALLRKADVAMYRAKADGGGAYRIFDPEMDAAFQATQHLKLAMRNAFANGNFELHYQPIVSAASRKVTSFEALLRWKHPERGWISPAEFVPLAESTGLIVQLGAWVLRQACVDAATWPGNLRVAVNLSPVQFRNGKLVATVFAALAASGLSPHRLELEITESVLLDRNDSNIAILERLRELGVRISLDDFGTGFSSLSYLRSFSFDKLKIDQSFVRNLLQDDRSETIVAAIAGLGISFGMATTAEGVESEYQLERLIAMGCTEIQGYFYSRPVPGNEVLAVARKVNCEDYLTD